MPRRSSYALDALCFFIADVQTGFGPFIAVYLANSGWGESAIGQALSVGTIAAVISQLPGGAFVDRLRDKRVAAAVACIVVGMAAVIFALSASRAVILTAEVLHSFGSAMLGPAIAAISLSAVGRAALGERLGRNARFAAIGNGAAAALLGAVGTLSARAVFWLTAGFMIPGLVALWLVTSAAPNTVQGDQKTDGEASSLLHDMFGLLADKRVLQFAGCVALFHLGNAALLPLAGSALTRGLGTQTNLVIAAAVVVPQSIVALLAPLIGSLADRRGSRLVLTLGFAAVPLRALLLASVTNPYGIIAVQALDGIGAATFGTMVPLVAAALTRGTGRFNLCLGTFGLATAAGATVSTSLAGIVAERMGEPVAFLILAACGCAAVLATFLAAPRNSPEPQDEPHATLPLNPTHPGRIQS